MGRLSKVLTCSTKYWVHHGARCPSREETFRHPLGNTRELSAQCVFITRVQHATVYQSDRAALRRDQVECLVGLLLSRKRADRPDAHPYPQYPYSLPGYQPSLVGVYI